MKLRKQFITKILMGVALLLVAALLTMVIYGAMALQSPTNAIPEMTVVYDGTPLSPDISMISSYDWWFFFTTKSEVLQQADSWMDLTPVPVLPGMPLSVEFSKDYNELKISRADEGSRTFIEVGGELRTPAQPGEYTYRVEAWWGYMGSAQFYFKLRVVDSSAPAPEVNSGAEAVTTLALPAKRPQFLL